MTRLDAPATGRNRGPILEILTRWLDASGPCDVLEIASGTGQHAVFFAAALPQLRWQPSDRDPDALASIEAWRAEAGLSNVLAPIRLDVRDEDWGVAAVDAIFNANMIHIAPWSVAEGLFRGAGRRLRPGGLLFLYGPFRIGGRHTAPSNEAFDAGLRRRDSEWGVRDLERVVELARAAGLQPLETHDMPANNALVVFRREGSGG
ncbi:MAG: DUF938 domain-containing protein [Myxococcota bacterium]